MQQLGVLLVFLLFGATEASATTIEKIAAAVDQRDDTTMIRGLPRARCPRVPTLVGSV